jgi:lipoprotein-anchoring transpeptidase ErfK/SrfK
MRRLVLPVKTSAVTVILLAGAVYMAAEAREAVVRRQELELARLEAGAPSTNGTGDPAKPVLPFRSISSPASASQASIAPSVAIKPQSNSTQAHQPANDEHKRQIIISIADRRLALLEDGKFIKAYPIAVGTESAPSPEGEFTIINQAVDPVYRHRGKEIQPGKGNPLGNRWMGLSLKGYGIHGTNVPGSVGKAASHGCFRMARLDVEDLYNRVKVGDTVIIRRERDALIAKVFPPPETAPAATAASDMQVASAATATVESTSTVAGTQQ